LVRGRYVKARCFLPIPTRPKGFAFLQSLYPTPPRREIVDNPLPKKRGLSTFTPITPIREDLKGRAFEGGWVEEPTFKVRGGLVKT
jgi:hypothetical protein